MRSLVRDEPFKGNDAIYTDAPLSAPTRAFSTRTRASPSGHKELLASISLHGYSSCICLSSSGFLPPSSRNPLVCARCTSTRHNSKRIDLCSNVLSLSLSLALTLFPVVGLLSIVEGRESRFCRLKPFAKADSSRTSDKKSMEDFSKENPRHSPKRTSLLLYEIFMTGR